MSLSRFWAIPSTKEQLIREAKTSQIIGSLFSGNSTASVAINSNSSLPQPITSKPQHNKEVALKYPTKTAWSLKFKQSTSYGKILISFYKTGAVNVWKNNKQLKSLRNQFLIDNQVNGKGTTIGTKITNFPKLTHEMSQALYMNRIENKTASDNKKADVVKHGMVAKTIDPELFTLTREEYQLLKRTPKDFWKLPGFALVFSIFVELTPLLCYVFPQITPSTCVLPNLMSRVWDGKSTAKVAELTTAKLNDTSKESVATLTAFNLDLDIIRQLARGLNLVSKYVPVNWYPESVIRDRVQNHYNYLMVDNYYLSGLNGNGNVWDLSPQELIFACLERNLVSGDLNQVLDPQNQYHLKADLARFIVDFEQFNIGYLCLQGFLDDTTALNQLN